MSRKTKKTVETVFTASELAESLGVLRVGMARDKLLNEVLTKQFKAALAREGLTQAGNYHLVRSDTYKVVVEELALPFALQRNLVKVDTSRIRDVFRLDSQLRFQDPSQFGFEITTQERVVPLKGDPEE